MAAKKAKLFKAGEKVRLASIPFPMAAKLGALAVVTKDQVPRSGYVAVKWFRSGMRDRSCGQQHGSYADDCFVRASEWIATGATPAPGVGGSKTVSVSAVTQPKTKTATKTKTKTKDQRLPAEVVHDAAKGVIVVSRKAIGEKYAKQVRERARKAGFKVPPGNDLTAVRPNMPIEQRLARIEATLGVMVSSIIDASIDEVMAIATMKS